MKKQTKKTTPVKITRKLNVKVIAVALAILIGILAYYRYGVAAVVNGKMISRWSFIKNMEKQSGEQILEQMITESLILSEGAKNKVVIGKDIIDAEIKVIADNIASQGSTLEEVLTIRGMSKKELEKQIKLQKILEKLAITDIQISDEQISEYLKTNKDLLPKGSTQEELKKMAKEDLAAEASNQAINSWLEKVRSEAKVVIR